MKNYTKIAAAASTLFGLCLLGSGCTQSMANKPNAEMSTGMMATDMKKPESGMMSDTMMAPKDMVDSKMDDVAKEKMEKTEMKNP
jgi:PBP1b-binding outer membrane lipoprotein LpoB